MSQYFVTFGQQYRTEPHPKVKYAHPDGWLTIEAPTMAEAREKAFVELGSHWGFIYENNKDFARHYFPLGELHRI